MVSYLTCPMTQATELPLTMTSIITDNLTEYLTL